MIKNIITSLFWIYNKQLSINLLNFILNILILRTLDPQIFGEFSKGVLYAQNILFFLGLQFNLTLIQFQNEPSTSNIDKNIIKLTITNIFIICLISIPISIYLACFNTFLIFITFIIFTFSNCTVLYSNTLFATYEKNLNFKKESIIIQIATIVALIISVILYLFNFNYEILVIKEAIKAIIILYLLLPNIKKSTLPYTSKKKIPIKILLFTLKRHLLKMIETLFFTVPLTLFSSKTSLTQFGILALCYNFISYICNFINPILTKFFYPFFIKYEQKNTFTLIFYLSNRLLLIAVILFSIYGNDLIILFYGTKWIETTQYIKNFYAYIFLYPLSILFHTYFLSKDYLFQLLTIWSAGVCFFFSIMLIKGFEIINFSQYITLSLLIIYILSVITFSRTEKNITLPYLFHIFISPLIFLLFKHPILLILIYLIDTILISKNIKIIFKNFKTIKKIS